MRTVTGPTDHVVVVGAGLSGLSAALRLAGAGRRVTVVERRDVPGGHAGRLEIGGYRFDTGPTVLTMPDLIADALDCVGEQMSDWLDLIPLEPLYRAFYPDGSSLDVYPDTERMTAEVEAFAGPEAAAGYRRFVDFVSELYRLEMTTFIDRNLDSPLDLVSPALARLVALGGFRRLAPRLRPYLLDERLERIYTFQSMYAGLSPHQALAVYAVIAYMDSVAGVFFPRGGMHQVPLALAGAAAKHGVSFRYGAGVARVDLHGDRARGVVLDDGEQIAADAVILTADLPTAYRTLLPPERTPRRVRSLRYSPSCYLLHVGSTAVYPRAGHHNILFGHAWEQTFQEIIGQGRLMSDPSILVTNPTRTDPTLAPAGRQSYYVLLPTPNSTAPIDWSVIAPRYRDEVVATLERRGFTGFGDSIEVERIVTPADWEASGSTAGTPFASAASFSQTGPFRPSNLAPGLENVVFAGSGTIPGVGVPTVLLSGRLAAERITGRDVTYRSRAVR